MIKKNSILSVVNVITSSLIMFMTYRFLLRNLGAELVGVWSVILAGVSITKLSEFGLAASSIKYIGKYIALNQPEKIKKVIETTASTMSISLGLLLLIIYYYSKNALVMIIPEAYISISSEIIPYALLSIWIGSIAGGLSSALDGMMRVDLRLIASVISTIVNFLSVIILVPMSGFKGIAYAQLIQVVTLLLINLSFLRKLIKVNLLNWDYITMKEMFKYGANFQIISIFTMLAEPITKILTTKYGGLSFTAFYEMAIRLITQLRSLIVSAIQVIVPKIAEIQINSPEKLNSIYKKIFNIVYIVAIVIFFSLIIFSRLISIIWIGYPQQDFIYCLIIISIASFINTLTTPAYFISLGTGHLLWNTVGHIIFGVCNLIFGIILGIYFSGIGVVWGYVVALVIGSIPIIIGYILTNKLSIGSILPSPLKGISLLSSLLLIALFIFEKIFNGESEVIYFAISAIIYSLFLIYFLRNNFLKNIYDYTNIKI